MLYKDTINGAEIQTNFLEIIDEAKAIVEPSNVDTTVPKINNMILSAAEPCKVTSRQTSRNVTRRKNVSPWYDEECEKQRKIYNALRNQYARSQDDDDKLRRNDAKLEYVKLCKMKTIQHEKLQTKKLMNAKYRTARCTGK